MNRTLRLLPALLILAPACVDPSVDERDNKPLTQATEATVTADSDDVHWTVNGQSQTASDPDYLPGATCQATATTAQATTGDGRAINCLGECGPGCYGILGTHYCTSACLAHDICVRCLGHTNSICVALFAAAAQSWYQCYQSGGAGCACPWSAAMPSPTDTAVSE